MRTEKTAILTTLFVAAIAATPIWVWISARLGKVEAYRVGMVGYILVLLSLLGLGNGATNLIYFIAIAAGFFHAAALMIPWTIIPDVVEYDELESGKRREGLLYGGTAFAYKLASALAVFFAGAGLEAFGYEANSVQSEESMTGILWVLSVAPAILLAVSLVATRGYLLTAKKHGEIRALLSQRKLN
jgi:GPH family glycoside/pentoside/hexuronide:cation symporter